MGLRPIIANPEARPRVGRRRVERPLPASGGRLVDYFGLHCQDCAGLRWASQGRYRGKLERTLGGVLAGIYGPPVSEPLPPGIDCAIQSRSLTSLQQRLFKTGGRLIRHARYFSLQPAESRLTPRTRFR